MGERRNHNPLRVLEQFQDIVATRPNHFSRTDARAVKIAALKREIAANEACLSRPSQPQRERIAKRLERLRRQLAEQEAAP